MNKKIFYTAVAVLVTFSVSAQEFRSGIKGGFNWSALYIDEVEDRQVRPGFNIGIYGQSQLGEATALQSELLYTTAGNRSTYNVGPFDGEADFNLNYLQLPVFFNFKIVDILELHAGGYGSFLIGANSSTEGDFGSSFQELDRGNFKDYDFGLVTGAAINFSDLQIGVRYNLGLTQIADSPAAKDLMGNSKNVVGQIYIALGL
ncbi:MAG: porin family protein [Cyclobacteriaceae bacterium]